MTERERAEQGALMEEPACIHHWVIQSPAVRNKGRSWGQCRKCGAEKIFFNSQKSRPKAKAGREEASGE